MKSPTPSVLQLPRQSGGGSSKLSDVEGLGGLQGPPEALRYFVYWRKSSEGEERQALSITSQDRELRRIFYGKPDISILCEYEEEQSAKRPGRPVFNAMLDRIMAGEAEGIIAYAPDRLARNPSDGGRLVQMLDDGVLRDLKFANYTFENNTQGKFMLQVLFAQSKQYSDNLSDHIHRTIRTKLDMGWWPNKAPPGYLNNHRERTIEIDPARAPLIKQMFALAGAGIRPSEIRRRANDDWGYRTPRGPKSGDRPLVVSAVHKILSNEFYIGLMSWAGKVYPGQHQPLVSIVEFERVQAYLQSRHWPRPQRQSFPFTGLIRCGECGHMITAENKRNRFGSRYTYYHCSKKAVPRCPQPSVSAADLERQVKEFLGSLSIKPECVEEVLAIVAENDHALRAYEQARSMSLDKAARGLEAQLRELTGLRLRDLLTDEQFVSERARLEQEQRKIAEGARESAQPTQWIEPLQKLFLISNQAVEWFEHANDADKRRIVKLVGSNPVLTDKILSIQPTETFVQMLRFSEITSQLGVKSAGRTHSAMNGGKRTARLLGVMEEARTSRLVRVRVLKIVMGLFQVPEVPNVLAQLQSPSVALLPADAPVRPS